MNYGKKLLIGGRDRDRSDSPIWPQMIGGRTTKRTSLSSTWWEKATRGSGLARRRAAKLARNSCSTVPSLSTVSLSRNGKIPSSRTCTRVKNLSKWGS